MRLELTGGFYEARSIIANAQRCLNLYPEINQDGAPCKLTHYQTPGLLLLSTCVTSRCRMLYQASNGNLYGVYGNKVYAIASNFAFTELGTIAFNVTPCYMQDNRSIIVLVDGTTSGYVIDMATNVMTTISDPAFYGATRVDYMDTYFVFNRPGTNQFYWSPSNWNGTDAFDSLDIATKTAYPDDIASLIVMYSNIWLIGNQRSTEVFYNSGNADSTFEQQPGTFIEHGTDAPYSLAKQDLAVYFLCRDQQGRAIVVRGGADYKVKRISTHAIENEIGSYETISDAIGWTYQQEGHIFYVLTFPTADKTWVYDEASEKWHERCWLDDDGNEHRIRANAMAFAYGKVICGDWQNGNLYELSLDAYTDNGQDIKRLRDFPHIVEDYNRVYYQGLIADMQVGSDTDPASEPTLSMAYSDTRGQTWSNALTQSLGRTGEYLTTPQYSRLGMARDRVFRLYWSGDFATALNGVFLEYKPGKS